MRIPFPNPEVKQGAGGAVPGLTRWPLCILCVGCCSSDQSVFPGKALQNETHEQVFALAGKDVTLPCHLATPVDPSRVTAVEWSRVDGRSPLIVHVLRDGKDLVKEKAPEYFNRTSVVRDGSLKLHSVRHQDAGRYR